MINVFFANVLTLTNDIFIFIAQSKGHIYFDSPVDPKTQTLNCLKIVLQLSYL